MQLKPPPASGCLRMTKKPLLSTLLVLLTTVSDCDIIKLALEAFLHLNNWIAEGSFKPSKFFFMESLIPAQDKRWRCALCM
jgi:hypothetical protein